MFLLGAVARLPELRGDQLAFVLAGEETVRLSSGPLREVAFYQRCLIARTSPQAHLVVLGQPLAIRGALQVTRSTASSHNRVEVVAKDVRDIIRPASDLIRDTGGGYRLRRGFQRVVVSGRAGDHAVPLPIPGGQVLAMSLAVPAGRGDQVNWIEVKSYEPMPGTAVTRGQRIVILGRLWNRDRIIGSGRRHTFSVVEMGEWCRGYMPTVLPD